MKKSISIISVILSVMLLLASCGNTDKKEKTPSQTVDTKLTKNTVTATIEFEDYDDIILELYPDLAPETVENFVTLAEDGFYDGLIFHRVIEDFMIQGGGYNENLKEQKTSSIKGEFSQNGFENTLSHLRGVISMARTAQNMDSASSQFFIVQKDSAYLDGQYAAFGQVTEGMAVVDEIASVKTGAVAASGMDDVPVTPVVIKTISIDTGSSSGKNSGKSSKSKNEATDKPSKLSDDDDDDNDTKSNSTSKSSFDMDDDDTDTRSSGSLSNSSDKSSSGSSSGSKSSSGNSSKTSSDEVSSLF
ncbi:MAG: peptidylprolyl isomerase [Clostridia bacterium]|nr:peptidylprolyl isomerase [Clostridia bacterium]